MTTDLRLSRRRGRLVLVVLALASVVGVVLAPPAGASVTYEPINGTGSTWSANAIERWISNVKANGITVNYSALGSTAGRSSFKSNIDDFGVSEIPYGVTPGDGPPPRTFAYMPIVAGGTALQYQLRVGNETVTDLRLAGETVAKIFTGQITNWNDPQITRDYGRALPNKPIVPVVRSDGSGTSAQFTSYLSKQHPTIWGPFCATYLGGQFCDFTSNYPQFPGSKALAGSDGVSNFVHASYGDGAIGYVEYSYALEKGDPVVKLLNANGYYVLPSASNVAVALTAAGFNPDRTQKLDGVYNNGDARAYPLSSYSYALVPTGTPESGGIRVGEGATLARFAYYFLCQGQSYVANIGYSPLPKVLVDQGLEVVRQIPGAQVQSISVDTCENPTFQGGRNVLLETAPQPPACDRVDAAPCGTGPSAGPGPGTAPSGAGGGAAAGTGEPGAAGGAGEGPVAAAAGEGAAAAPVVDPVTGLALGAGPGTEQAGTQVLGAATEVAALRETGPLGKVLYGIAAAALLVVVLGPPLLSRRLRRRPSAAHPLP